MVKKKVLYGIIIAFVILGIIYLFIPLEDSFLVDENKITAYPGVRYSENILTPANSFEQKILFNIEALQNSFSLYIFNDSESLKYYSEEPFVSLYQEINITVINKTILISPPQEFIFIIILNEEDQYLNITAKINFHCFKYQYNWSIFSFSVSGVIFIYLIYKKKHQFQPSR